MKLNYVLFRVSLLVMCGGFHSTSNITIDEYAKMADILARLKFVYNDMTFLFFASLSPSVRPCR